MSGVTDPAEAYFKDGLWGFYSGVWQKLAMVWGFSSQYLEKEIVVKDGAGDEVLVFSSCPAGVARVVLGMCAYNNKTAVSRIELRMKHGATVYVLDAVVGPGARQTAVLSRPIVLVLDDLLETNFVDCLNNDTVSSVAWGYDMALGA